MTDPRLLAAVTVLLWSFGSTVARLISMRSQALYLALSFSFTLVTFALYFWRQRRAMGSPPPRHWRPEFAFWGLFGYFFYITCFNRSFRAFDSASETVILNYTWPLFTVVFTRLFARARASGHDAEGPSSATWVEALGIGLGFLSVVLVATQGHLAALGRLANLRGTLWGLGAGVSYGIFGAYSSRVPREEHANFLLTAIAASWVLMAAASIPEGSLLASLSAFDIALVALSGCLLNGVGYITWTRANRLARERGMSVSVIASLTLLLPLLNLFWVSLLLGESAILRPYFAASLALIVASCLLCQNAAAVGAWARRLMGRA